MGSEMCAGKWETWMHFVNWKVLRCNSKYPAYFGFLLSENRQLFVPWKRHAGCRESSELPREVFNLDRSPARVSMVNHFLRNAYNAESVQRMLISKPLYTGHNEEGQKVHSFGNLRKGRKFDRKWKTTQVESMSPAMIQNKWNVALGGLTQTTRACPQVWQARQRPVA